MSDEGDPDRRREGAAAVLDEFHSSHHSPPPFSNWCPLCDLEAAEARVRGLEGALADAVELAAEGWGYAGDYFCEKWDVQGRMDAIKDAAGCRCTVEGGRAVWDQDCPLHHEIAKRVALALNPPAEDERT